MTGEQLPINFTNRNHFTSVDWNKTNNLKGYLQDITRTIKNQRGQPIALVAQAKIDKPGWYQHQANDAVAHHNYPGLPPLSIQEKQQRSSQLREFAKHAQPVISKVKYVPLTELFAKDGRPNMYVFQQIPSGSIIEIVRPNWNMHNRIGTNLNISHLGFAVRTQQGLMFRHASLTTKKVSDVRLINYLRQYLKSPTIKGINVQQPLLVKLNSK